MFTVADLPRWTVIRFGVISHLRSGITAGGVKNPLIQ
jgi:hypothetical protein